MMRGLMSSKLPHAMSKQLGKYDHHTMQFVSVCLPSDGRGEVGVEGGSQAIMEVVWGVNLP